MMKQTRSVPRTVKQRQAQLTAIRNLKMASSAHAYVRGNTAKFYEWLETTSSRIPDGPAVWICGDCHLSNLGPVADADGQIEIQVRDLDQTVIGNPAHDLIRLGLSLAMAARSSDLPGIITATMLEELIDGYTHALRGRDRQSAWSNHPDGIRLTLRRALRRQWRHLADERIDGTSPNIPLGKRFWPLLKEERESIDKLAETEDFRRLLTSLNHRKDDDDVNVLDAAYWVKGCSSLGRLRCAVLVSVGKRGANDKGMSLVDIKQATPTVAPHAKDAEMPPGHAARVVEGARALAPFLGDRMLSATVSNRPVVVRELLPQDLKIDTERLEQHDAGATARYLAAVLGHAHGRQMTRAHRMRWAQELRRYSTKSLDAPSWLWTSIVDLIQIHEAAYLEHCRRFAHER
jgi:uncharacterized protein (DUF2252 family)